MRQCDRIWVPDDDGDYEVCDVEYITPEIGRLSPEYNVVVLTLEELREVFHEGHKSGIHRTVSQPVDNPYLNSLLDTYLTSKGIIP